MNSLAKILGGESLGAWRREVAGDAPVAVVSGTFDFFHPGNLHVIRKASQLSLPLVVLVEPDDVALRQGRQGYPQNNLETRMEMVSHLRGVAAVTSLGPEEVDDGLAALAPFVRVAALPLAGCFSGDVLRAMEEHRTPFVLPREWEEEGSASGKTMAAPLPNKGLRVTVNGCFDILHVGHLRFLAEARMMGDWLTVLINSDASVARYKGPTRPVFPERFRTAALRALGSVDEVLIFDGDNPLAEIEQLRPAIHVKGGSYEPDRVRQERELVESWGGRLVCTPMVNGFSSTNFIRKALKK